MRASEFIVEAPNKHDQQTIDLIKTKRDSGDSASKIANDIGLSVSQVQHIIKRHYTDRVRLQQPIDNDTIELVKMLWDEGKGPTAISKDLGIPLKKVNRILELKYPERQNKNLMLGTALTDDDKKTITDLYLNGASATDIADQFGIDLSTVPKLLYRLIGVDKYNEIKKLRYGQQGLTVGTTPEQVQQMADLYRKGYVASSIPKMLGLNVQNSTVDYHLRRLPNWIELRTEHLINRQSKPSVAVTTTKTRSGIGDNQGLKGPQSRHTWGRFPSTKWGMHKP